MPRSPFIVSAALLVLLPSSIASSDTTTAQEPLQRFVPTTLDGSRQVSTSVTMLKHAWTAEGLHDIRVRPLWLVPTKPRRLPLDNLTVSHARNCANVVLIGPRISKFQLVTTARDNLSKLPFPQNLPSSSKAGLLSFHLCGPEIPAARSALVADLTSSRPAIIYVITGISPDSNTPPVLDVLPERTQDEEAPPPSPKLPPASATNRATTIRFLENQGPPNLSARLQSLTFPPANNEGEAMLVEQLQAGCHVLSVARRPSPNVVVPRDIDMRVFSATSRTRLESDLTYAPNASVKLCIGTQRRVLIEANGALPGMRLPLDHASWPIPSGIPDHWPAAARANCARALLRLRSPWLSQSPVWTGAGSIGPTDIPVHLPSGRCYVALTGLESQEPASTLLRVSGSEFSSRDAGKRPYTGVSFCTKSSSTVRLHVEAFGSRGTKWIGGIWRTSVFPLPSSRNTK